MDESPTKRLKTSPIDSIARSSVNTTDDLSFGYKHARPVAQDPRASPPTASAEDNQIVYPILNQHSNLEQNALDPVPDQMLSDENRTLNQQAAPKLQADDAELKSPSKPMQLGIESSSSPPKILLSNSPNQREKTKKCSEAQLSPSESSHFKSRENPDKEFFSGLRPRMLVSGPQLSTKLRKPSQKSRTKSK